jgi:hypothetical protein
MARPASAPSDSAAKMKLRIMVKVVTWVISF